MKRQILQLLLILFVAATGMAKKHVSIDKSNPVVLQGKSISYKGEKIILGEKAIYLDGSLTDAECSKTPYVYNKFEDAVKALKAGTSNADRMMLYVAPYVYWVDDPDDPAIRQPNGAGASPIGCFIDCAWLEIHGLTENAENVVFASNRGQSQGSNGNFTMFYFRADGLRLQNITFGNYCNIDLDYKLMPSLSRKRRMDAITQAQLAFSKGDYLEAHNCRFVSRLNTCPLNGGKRTIFTGCHFESTDDAMCSNGVYVDCDFDVYGTMPFGHTNQTGAVMFNCDINTIPSELDIKRANQFLIKNSNSPIMLVDCRFHTPDGVYLGFTPRPVPYNRYYIYNVTHNGVKAQMQSRQPQVVADMAGKPILDAYRVEHNGKVIYNTYNILAGDDGWDPMHIGDEIKAIEAQTGRKFHDLPVFLGTSQRELTMEEGSEPVLVKLEPMRFNGLESKTQKCTWRSENPKLVGIKPSIDGMSCKMVSLNQTDTAQQVMVTVENAYGLQSAMLVTAAPRTLEAPSFVEQPTVKRNADGTLTVSYRLDSERPDHSLITWYACDDAKGNGALPVSVSRMDKPEYTYTPQPADVGHYLMAKVEPKTIRSQVGTPLMAVTAKPVAEADIHNRKVIDTDFHNFPSDEQHLLLPGRWTLDGHKPADTHEYTWQTSGDNWIYRLGRGGHRGYGMAQKSKGARMLYTPTPEQKGDMELTMRLDVGKEIGQGFASATGQYFDVYLHFDTETLTGYALRIIRTTKYANAVDMQLMRYDHGKTTQISEAVSTTCFISPCVIRLWSENGVLHANVKTEAQQRRSNLASEVLLSAPMIREPYYGTGHVFTGSTGDSALMLHHLKVTYK